MAMVTTNALAAGLRHHCDGCVRSDWIPFPNRNAVVRNSGSISKHGLCERCGFSPKNNCTGQYQNSQFINLPVEIMEIIVFSSGLSDNDRRVLSITCRSLYSTVGIMRPATRYERYHLMRRFLCPSSGLSLYHLCLHCDKFKHIATGWEVLPCRPTLGPQGQCMKCRKNVDKVALELKAAFIAVGFGTGDGLARPAL